MATAKVTSITVTYQSQRTIRECAASLERCHRAGLLDAVFVDNASRDQTPAILAGQRGWATVVDSPGNIGYGRGCNFGMLYVRTPYVAIVNPDATLEPEPLRVLLEFLDANPRIGMAAPALTGDGGELQDAGELPTPSSTLRSAMPRGGRVLDRRAIIPGEPPRRVEWVCGALFVMPTDVMRKVGGFDPRFFLYWEETDLCRRVAQAGAEIWTTGKCVAHHVGGASIAESTTPRYAGCITEHYFRSRMYYFRKHYGWMRAAWTELAEIAILAACFPSGRARAQLKARWAGPVLKMPDILPGMKSDLAPRASAGAKKS